MKQNQASSATPATAAKPTAATAVNSDEQTLYQNAITALTAKNMMKQQKNYKPT
ncbi:MAG: hypothetical protein HWD59_00785 [Coxiellaceae bacterium]|nr:MAG: hypothetical protein HWD59_00785 [Coxiellaceae bacterium]